MKKNGGKRYLTLFILLALAALLAFGQDILDIGDAPAPAGEAPTASISATTAASKATAASKTAASQSTAAPVDRDGAYFDRDRVALYIHLYGHLPDNFITKDEARKLGWESGPVETYAPGRAIGGDRFGNYEGLLPEKAGRAYTECDIDTRGASSRGAKRIVFSNDGLIYYTADHYETFTLLYGKD